MPEKTENYEDKRKEGPQMNEAEKEVDGSMWSLIYSQREIEWKIWAIEVYE